jgi:hypothetical protein
MSINFWTHCKTSVTPGVVLIFGHFGTSSLIIRYLVICLSKKLKQFLYWPGRVLRFREVWGFHISRQSAHGGGKVSSHTYRPLLLPRMFLILVSVRGCVDHILRVNSIKITNHIITNSCLGTWSKYRLSHGNLTSFFYLILKIVRFPWLPPYKLCCMKYIYITAIGLTPGGSSTAHIYTQTIHRIQLARCFN